MEAAVETAPIAALVSGEVVHEDTPQGLGPTPGKPILELDWQTDLTQIETDREKLQAAQARAHEEPPPAPPQKRERKPLPPLSDEPLIQVETIHGSVDSPKPDATQDAVG